MRWVRWTLKGQPSRWHAQHRQAGADPAPLTVCRRPLPARVTYTERDPPAALRCPVCAGVLGRAHTPQGEQQREPREILAHLRAVTRE